VADYVTVDGAEGYLVSGEAGEAVEAGEELAAELVAELVTADSLAGFLDPGGPEGEGVAAGTPPAEPLGPELVSAGAAGEEVLVASEGETVSAEGESP
jgi:hypothetical protein